MLYIYLFQRGNLLCYALSYWLCYVHLFRDIFWKLELQNAKAIYNYVVSMHTNSTTACVVTHYTALNNVESALQR